MPSGMLDQLWTSIADAGRDLVRNRLYGRRRPQVRDLCRDLLSNRGEASGAALARELVDAYRAMNAADRLAFLTMLAHEFGHDQERITAAIDAYHARPTAAAAHALRRAFEAPRQELF